MRYADYFLLCLVVVRRSKGIERFACLFGFFGVLVIARGSIPLRQHFVEVKSRIICRRVVRGVSCTMRDYSLIDLLQPKLPWRFMRFSCVSQYLPSLV